MTGRADHQLVGPWRIVEADLWERDFLDLVGPAMLTIRADGTGEIAFGAVQAGLDIDYATSMVFFTWTGFDEMDEVTGDGSAELLDEGSLEIEFAYHLGDEAVLKAVRKNSSTACSHDRCQPLVSWRFLRRRRTQGHVDAQGRRRN
jgi:hypothetical protein